MCATLISCITYFCRTQFFSIFSQFGSREWHENSGEWGAVKEMRGEPITSTLKQLHKRWGKSSQQPTSKYQNFYMISILDSLSSTKEYKEIDCMYVHLNFVAHLARGNKNSRIPTPKTFRVLVTSWSRGNLGSAHLQGFVEWRCWNPASWLLHSFLWQSFPLCQRKLIVADAAVGVKSNNQGWYILGSSNPTFSLQIIWIIVYKLCMLPLTYIHRLVARVTSLLAFEPLRVPGSPLPSAVGAI
jgi:hypothetical protein